MDKPLIRKFFLTNDPLQLKILSLILVSMLVPVFFVGSFFYLLMFKILSETPLQPGSAPFDIYPVIMRTNLAIVLGFVPLFFLILVWGVLISHRITGPTLRLKREMEKMIESGDFKSRLSVRKHDYIKPFVEMVNRLLDKFYETATKK